jgi:uncharacterized cupin superfamily protein
VADDPHIVRTAALDWAQVFRGRHPFNAASEMRLAPLGDKTGLQRVGVSLIRIPPGKESFIPHAHALQEEFVFILEGAGEVTLDGVVHPVGPGDFVGFPTDGVVHSLKAVGPGDLVYLTGGERTATEIAEMPTIGKTMVIRGGQITMYGKDNAEEISQAEWFSRVRLDD